MAALLNKLKSAPKVSVDITQFVVAAENGFVRCGGCSIVDFYSSSYQEEAMFVFCWPERQV
jgi:hypothetical protein